MRYIESIDEPVRRYELAHGAVCPTAMLGIRMALLGCHLVCTSLQGIEDRSTLNVWVETGPRLCEGVEVVSRRQSGYPKLKLIEHGKLAATFLNLATKKAVRIEALETSLRLADVRYPTVVNESLRQINLYREAKDEELFTVDVIHFPMNSLGSRLQLRSRMMCAACGEAIIIGGGVKALAGITLCRSCAFGDGIDTKPRQPFIESNVLVH